jgi:hypothetical protein
MSEEEDFSYHVFHSQIQLGNATLSVALPQRRGS